MYFVLHGEVEVTSGPLCDHLGYIGTGGFFGETVILESVQRVSGTGTATRNRTVRATTDCELGVLAAESVLRACDCFPELQVRLSRFARSAGDKTSAGLANSRKRAKTRQRTTSANTVLLEHELDKLLAEQQASDVMRTADQAADALVAATGNNLAMATEHLLAAHRRMQK